MRTSIQRNTNRTTLGNRQASVIVSRDGLRNFDGLHLDCAFFGAVQSLRHAAGCLASSTKRAMRQVKRAATGAVGAIERASSSIAVPRSWHSVYPVPVASVARSIA